MHRLRRLDRADGNFAEVCMRVCGMAGVRLGAVVSWEVHIAIGRIRRSWSFGALRFACSSTSSATVVAAKKEEALDRAQPTAARSLCAESTFFLLPCFRTQEGLPCWLAG